MLRFLAALIACCSALAQAEDLGRFGKSYPIAERDLIEVFKARAQARVDDGTWNKAMEAKREQLKGYVKRPLGKRLPRALEYSVRYFDPTIEVPDDIADANGKILVAKGTRVNPLDYRNYPTTLCFFDGDDQAQVEWARQYCFDELKAKGILVNGPVLELMEKFKVRLYFDQYGRLGQHFGVKAVPTVIRQSGKVFAVEEFGVGL